MPVQEVIVKRCHYLNIKKYHQWDYKLARYFIQDQTTNRIHFVGIVVKDISDCGLYRKNSAARVGKIRFDELLGLFDEACCFLFSNSAHYARQINESKIHALGSVHIDFNHVRHHFTTAQF